MPPDLFAGIPVSDYAAALPWYERLIGSPPTFVAHAAECVWDVAEHRSVYIVEQPEHAGHARVMLLVEDFDAEIAAISARGVEPDRVETYGDGVRKATYCDDDGNEFGVGGMPLPHRGPASRPFVGIPVSSRDPEGSEISVGGPPAE